MQHETVLTGSVDTYFIGQSSAHSQLLVSCFMLYLCSDDNPQLFSFQPSQNRAQKVLHYLGEVKVNGPTTPLVTGLQPARVQPAVPELPAGIK